MNIQGSVQNLKSFALECKRVLTITRKPSREEFRTIVTVSGIGIAVIGIIGFLMQLFVRLTFK